MKLELDPSDLSSEYQKGTPQDVDQNCSTSQVTFDKLNLKAQATVRAAGKAIFFSWDRQTYNAVYPPKE
ncbi:MAG TPA: hypothetical protein PLD14_02745 [Candidatus Pacearchaeota archaeon]|nr:hypothetical protein [Candidatus Pacearchaeota archaeon]HPR80119.1 hypothetical protein [Candidatus Pacearchaeota archaeon]